MSRTHEVALIDGDGIGPELVESAVEVLDALASRHGFTLNFTRFRGGAAAYTDLGTNLEPGALERFQSREFAAIMKGPVGLPGVRRPDGTESGLLGGVLRGGLDTYANVRPIQLFEGVKTPVVHAPGTIDYVIVRENTEGLYLSRGLGIGTSNAMVDQLFISRAGTERVARYAFELARTRNGAPADGVRRVTVVDKSNVLRSFALFHDVVEEVAKEYPDIELDHRYSDAAAHDLVLTPSHFDVVLTENFVGDLLSDLGAATVGGLGMCGTGNLGDGAAYFEPVHGTAPTIAGQDCANPSSQLLCAAMMLEHIGEPAAAAALRDAVRAAFREGIVRLDEFGRPAGGTRAVTRGIVDLVSSR